MQARFFSRRKREGRVWALHGYLYRCLDQDETTFAHIQATQDLQGLFRALEKEYKATFGVENVTYNTHMYFRHVLEQRLVNGPLHEWSSLKYESLYGLLGMLYKSGTIAPGKQALQNFFLRDRHHHLCRGQRTLLLKPL